MLDKFIKRLTKDLELEGSLATEVPGVYSIPVDEDLSVLISSIPRGFSLSCTIYEKPKENLEEFYTQALLANLFSKGTEGSVLGLDSEGAMIVLSREVDWGINNREFQYIIEDFLNSVDFWKKEVKAYYPRKSS